MAHKFASVEWLSQSSRENTRISNRPMIQRDSERSVFRWSTLNGPCSTVINQVAPCSGNQRLTSSPRMLNADMSSYSIDYKDSCTSESPGLSPVLPLTKQSQSRVEPSRSPVCGDLYDGLGNTDHSTMLKPTSPEDLPTSIQEPCENQAETKNFNEDATNSSCSPGSETGYESESSRSDATSPVEGGTEETCDASDEEGKSNRRMRTAFTTEQISTLESTFQKQKYLGASERRKLAAKLQLSEVQIKTWFQNRRMKHKREMQEGRQGQFHPAQIYGVYGFPPPLQTYQYAPPVQTRYATNPLLEPVSINYNSQTPVMDHLSTFSHQKVQMFMPPHQTVFPPSYQFDEQYVRY